MCKELLFVLDIINKSGTPEESFYLILDEPLQGIVGVIGG